MKRTLLLLLSISVLALAGSVIAQTDYGSTDQPGYETPSTSPMDSAAIDVAPPSPTEGSSPEPSYADDPAHESLPATASPLPLALAIGVSALGAAVALRAYRLRSAH